MNKIIAIATVYESVALVSHFVSHYFRLGVDSIILNVNTYKNHDLIHQCLETCAGQRVLISSVSHPDISDELKDRDENVILKENSTENDWILHLDLDEFHEYPYRLPTVVSLMDLEGVTMLSGMFVDRISYDGVLREISQNETIFSQFPIGCSITKDWIGTPHGKVMLCKSWVKLCFGRHCAINTPSNEPALACKSQYRVHHFKWFAGIQNRLYYRGSLHGIIEGAYPHQCHRMAASIINNCIEPASVPNYELCGDFEYPSS